MTFEEWVARPWMIKSRTPLESRWDKKRLADEKDEARFVTGTDDSFAVCTLCGAHIDQIYNLIPELNFSAQRHFEWHEQMNLFLPVLDELKVVFEKEKRHEAVEDIKRIRKSLG